VQSWNGLAAGGQFTADLDTYTHLDPGLQAEASHWKDVGYRVLVLTWEGG
jgi:hypothetical protein